MGWIELLAYGTIAGATWVGAVAMVLRYLDWWS
jgi:hypothetical protein